MSTNMVIRRQAALDFPEMKSVFPVDFGTYLDTYFIFTEENLRLGRQAFHHSFSGSSGLGRNTKPWSSVESILISDAFKLGTKRSTTSLQHIAASLWGLGLLMVAATSKMLLITLGQSLCSRKRSIRVLPAGGRPLGLAVLPGNNLPLASLSISLCSTCLSACFTGSFLSIREILVIFSSLIKINILGSFYFYLVITFSKHTSFASKA